VLHAPVRREHVVEALVHLHDHTHTRTHTRTTLHQSRHAAGRLTHAGPEAYAFQAYTHQPLS
jgi:hypothetical protein